MRTEPFLATELLAAEIGTVSWPAAVVFGAGQPKPRSGKIIRRLLRDIADSSALGDTTTLCDAAVART
ncbi:MAG: hypothetical protein ACE5EV_00910 [Gaiellales bacterium]